MQNTILKGAVIPAGEGKTFNLLGHAITTVFTKQTTEGHYYVFEVVTPPGFGLPPHIHEHEDELIHVLEGELEIILGDEKILAKAGDHILFPRQVVHAFQNPGSKAAKAVFTVVPGGNFEDFFNKLAALPPGPPDMPKIIAIFAEYGMEIILPQAVQVES